MVKYWDFWASKIPSVYVAGYVGLGLRGRTMNIREIIHRILNQKLTVENDVRVYEQVNAVDKRWKTKNLELFNQVDEC